MLPCCENLLRAASRPRLTRKSQTFCLWRKFQTCDGLNRELARLINSDCAPLKPTPRDNREESFTPHFPSQTQNELNKLRSVYLENQSHIGFQESLCAIEPLSTAHRAFTCQTTRSSSTNTRAGRRVWVHFVSPRTLDIQNLGRLLVKTFWICSCLINTFPRLNTFEAEHATTTIQMLLLQVKAPSVHLIKFL